MSYTQKRHDRALARKNTYKHIQKRAYISKCIWDSSRYDYLTKDGKQIHRLSKAKVHCSCPMCQQKTRNLGWKHSDQVKLAKGYGK